MTRSILPLCFLVLSTPTWAAAQDNPFLGTWEADYALTTPPSSGVRNVRSYVITREAWGTDGIRLSGTRVSMDGKTLPTNSYEARFDGRDYPYMGNPNRDTVSLERVDSHRILSVYKKDGRVVLRQTNALSADGSTIYTIGQGPDGKVRGVTVWHKK